MGTIYSYHTHLNTATMPYREVCWYYINAYRGRSDNTQQPFIRTIVRKASAKDLRRWLTQATKLKMLGRTITPNDDVTIEIIYKEMRRRVERNKKRNAKKRAERNRRRKACKRRAGA